jgi:hypothetical protein
MPSPGVRPIEPRGASTLSRIRRLKLKHFFLALLAPVYAVAVLDGQKRACARRPRSHAR